MTDQPLPLTNGEAHAIIAPLVGTQNHEDDRIYRYMLISLVENPDCPNRTCVQLPGMPEEEDKHFHLRIASDMYESWDMLSMLQNAMFMICTQQITQIPNVEPHKGGDDTNG